MFRIRSLLHLPSPRCPQRKSMVNSISHYNEFIDHTWKHLLYVAVFVGCRERALCLLFVERKQHRFVLTS